MAARFRSLGGFSMRSCRGTARGAAMQRCGYEVQLFRRKRWVRCHGLFDVIFQTSSLEALPRILQLGIVGSAVAG